MTFTVEKRDLLTVPQGYMLAHCVSADYALGMGVAKQIDKAFGMREMLRRTCNSPNPDGCCVVCANVFNLVTKEKYWQKPTLKSIHRALFQMRALAEMMGVKKIAMPKIGCGLDGRNWNIVSQMIQDVFAPTDIDILICEL